MPTQRVNIKHIREHPNARFETLAAHYGIELVPSRQDADQCKMLCPFHDDHRPSCGVNLAKRQFHCFPCGAGGNILDFVMQMEETDARQAAITLAEICGIETAPGRATKVTKKLSPTERLRQRREQATPSVPPTTVTDRPKKEKPAPAVDSGDQEPTPLAAYIPYTRTLPLDASHPYLTERGIPQDFAEAYEIGYCARGFQRNRIAIRLHDEDGNPLGYAGRWAEKEPPEGQVRYLLPRDFPKQRVLYNLHRLPADTDMVVIVESYWSVFRLAMLSHPVVSAMGRAISPEQIALLRARGIKMVCLLFDGDDAGREGVAAALPELAKHVFVHAPAVPDGFKPHSADETLLRQLIG